jgi:tetratricopeptide (TPR) repeat protein
MTEHFQRYSAPDPVAHAREIERLSAALSACSDSGSLGAIDLSADLASLLTSARREAEARELLVPLLSAVREHLSSEPAGWYYLSFGTASQYLGLRAEANAMFAEALNLARAQGWERLEHFVLAHWGRSLVEEGELSQARECFDRALAIRERLNDPGVASVRGLLQALAVLESGDA